MTVNDFATLTRRVIAKDGFEGFQPTACFPVRRNIRALAGIPENADVEAVTLEWAKGIAEPGEEFLVAFKASNEEFKVIRVAEGRQESVTFGVAQKVLQADAAAPRGLI